MPQIDFNEFIANMGLRKSDIGSKPVIFIYNKFYIKNLFILYQNMKELSLTPLVITVGDEVEIELKKKIESINKRDIKNTLSEIEDYLDWTRPEYYNLDIDTKAIDLAETWYLKNGYDYTRFDDFPMGDIHFHEMSYYFVGVLKRVEEIKYIIANEKITDLIFLEGDDDSEMLSGYGVDMRDYGRVAEILCCQDNSIKVHRLVINDNPSRPKKVCFNLVLRGLVKKSMCLLMHIYKSIINFRREYKNNILMNYYAYPERKLVDSFLNDPGTRVILSTESYEAIRQFALRRNFYCFETMIRGFFRKTFRAENNYKRFEIFKKEKSGSFIYKGIDIWPLLENKIYYLFERGFNKSLSDIYAKINVLKTFNVNKVILDTDVSLSGREYAYAAKYLGIKSFIIQHGVAATDREKDFMFVPLRADKFLAWDKITEKWLINHGVEKRKINVCGSLRIDYIRDISKNTKIRNQIVRKVYSDFNVEKNMKILLFASQTIRSSINFPNLHIKLKENLEYIKVLSQSVNSLRDMILIVKLHPGDNSESFVKDRLRDQGFVYKNIYIVKDYPIDDLILASYIFVSLFSSTIFFAAAAEVPVVSINFRGIPFYGRVAFGGSNCFLREARNKEDLQNSLHALSNKVERDVCIARGKEFLNEYFPGNEVNNILNSVIF